MRFLKLVLLLRLFCLNDWVEMRVLGVLFSILVLLLRLFCLND